MTRLGCGLAACVLIAGCSGPSLEERPLTAAEMPVSFAYGALGPDDAIYERAVDPRRGWGVRRLKMADGGELAMLDLISLSGAYGLEHQDTRRWVSSMLQEPAEVTWGDTLRVSAARQTEMHAFQMADDLACVGLQRCLREHAEAAPGDGCQELVVGFYCRVGPALDAEEARKVALAVHGTL